MTDAKYPDSELNPDNPDSEVEWDNDLDTDEINDILGFDLSGETGEDRSGLRALINSALVSHRRMPLLDVIFDRSARHMTTSLRHLTNENVDVSLDDTSALRFGEFIGSISGSTVVGVLRAERLDNLCLLAVDAAFVYSIVDVLLGGRRGGSALYFEDRGFTQIELGLVEKVMGLIAGDLAQAFQPVAEVQFSIDRIETTPRFATIAQDASVCSLAKFRIDMEDRGGRAAILIPHATLEPVQKILRQEYFHEGGAGEKIWRDHLMSQITAARIDLKAVIAERDISLEDLAGLSCGDTIQFTGFSGERAEIRAGALAVASGAVGKSGETIALKLAETTMGRVQNAEGEAQSQLNANVAADEEAA
ncbi:MAG: flagellar motor switch protein FliM [Pseudomonadota bacterium]